MVYLVAPNRNTAEGYVTVTVPGEGKASDDREPTDGSEGNSPDDQRSDPSDAFSALSDPLRVDILRELSAHHRTTGEADIGFADLRRRVGVRDSGRFRYHLNELREYFIERTEDGYRLTHAGIQVVAAIIAGTYTETVSMGPDELDSQCPFCGQAAIATYEDGVCFVTCDDDHALFQWSVPPNASTDATLLEIVDLAQMLAFQAIEQTLLGVCPQCYDTIETTVTAGEGSRPVFRAVCDTCGAQVVGPVAFCLLVDPDVAAFCGKHGLTVRDDHVWEFPFVADDAGFTIIDEDPVRIECTISLDNETLTVTVDGRGHVDRVHPPGKK